MHMSLTTSRCSQKIKMNKKDILDLYVMFMKYFSFVLLSVINPTFFMWAEVEARNVFHSA